jgi:hypothetical protein
MKQKIQKLITLISIFIVSSNHYSNACHGTALLNISQSLNKTGVTISATSSNESCQCSNPTPTNPCNCNPYRVDIELVCIGEAFTGTPNYFSATMDKFQSGNVCLQQTYPAKTISFSDLCVGATYKWRVREFVTGSGSAGPWSSQFSFVTPGVGASPVFSASASSTVICSGNTTTLNAYTSGGCGKFGYSWSNGLGTSASISVNPAVTTTYSVTITDLCAGFTQNIPITITVNSLPTANAGADKQLCFNTNGTVPLGVPAVS